MQIKLAIIDRDEQYLSKITIGFQQMLQSKVELYAFTSYQDFDEFSQQTNVDVVLISEEISVDFESFSNQQAVGYLVDTNHVECVNERRAICKFQRPEDIYKQLLALYSEYSTNIYRFQYQTTDTTELILFMGVAGGVGCSTLAAAYSMHQANLGKKVLFISMEDYSSLQIFFKGEGIQNFSNIVYAAKSKQANIQLKIESCTKKDLSGVEFISECTSALDVLEIEPDEIGFILSELSVSNQYHLIVIDNNLPLDAVTQFLLDFVTKVILISDGNAISQLKLTKLIAAIKHLETKNKLQLFSKLRIVYNKFVEGFSIKTDTIPSDQQKGEIPEFCKTEPKVIANHIATTADFFESLMT